MTTSRLLLAALLAAACSGEKTSVSDDFSDLDGVDEKADAFSSRMLLVGSLDYGTASRPVAYSRTPVYRAFKFSGKEGDAIDVTVTSSDGGDAVTWVVDNRFHILAVNDDASADTLDSHVTLTLPHATSNTHYIIFREYSYRRAHFTVTLGRQQPVDLKACQTDDDCVRVPADCCELGRSWDAVTAGNEDAYRASLMCPANQVCPRIAFVDDGSVAECNAGTHECQAVKPADVVCGGRMLIPHECPTGYVCYDPGAAYDAPGSCVKTCGGIAGRTCDDGFSCADDPSDNCDPANGGADCGGICLAN
jgi:hypothetical protein